MQVTPEILTNILVISSFYVGELGSDELSTGDIIGEGNFTQHRRIITEAAEPGEFKEVVGLQIRYADNSRTICTGTCLNDWYVLTAGHCVYGSTIIIVRINCVDLYACTNARRGMGLVHPQFQPGKDMELNDLGLVRAETPMLAPEFAQVMENTRFCVSCIAVGYGSTKNDRGPLNSRLVKLIVIEPFRCTDMFPSKKEFADMVCAYDSRDTDLLPWDSGGPLYCGQTQIGVNIHFLRVFNTQTGENVSIVFWLTSHELMKWTKVAMSSANHNLYKTALQALLLFCLSSQCFLREF